jgi:hypothetical protein
MLNPLKAWVPAGVPEDEEMTDRFGLAHLVSLAWVAAACVHASPSNGASSAAAPGDEACLAYTPPNPATLFASDKKVFAHYFYPFPLSIDNKPAAQDYYNTQWLAKDGESSKWSAQGGYLRQRPLGVDVVPDPNWRLRNVEREVRMAIARGVTGFTVDVLSGKEADAADSHLNLLLRAAQTVDPRFKIVVMPDISALKSDSDSVIKIIVAVAASPAAYRLADGRLVVTAFNAGANPPQWWQSVLAQLMSKGINIAFVPTFLGWGGQADAFASISHGFADWGTATAAVSDQMKDAPGKTHDKYGKIFMMPVDPQQYRPKNSIYWEAGNSSTFRNAWASSINGGADWVQLVTWSDFSESSQIEPYTDATLQRNIGTGFYNLTGYYAAWFLSGTQPTITHDVLYYFYRREPTTAAAPSQSMANKIVNSSAEDDIELLAFLAAPGELAISIGGHRYVQMAPAGITSFKIPTQPGVPAFTLSRGGSDLISFKGAVEIFGQTGIPSGVIDMTYWSGSASNRGVCSL